MKIDHDYVKSLLEACQASETPTFDIFYLETANYDCNDAKFEFHLAILNDQEFVVLESGDKGFGLVKGIDGYSSWAALPLRLTASGHDFIDTIKNPEVWDRTKSAAKRAGGVGLNFLIQIAKIESQKYIEKVLAISF